MKALNVTVLPKYNLEVTFDDGISGIIDLEEFIKNGVFSVLKDKHLFSKVYTTGYSIAWNEELEIDALTIYAELTNKNPEDILSDKLNYASN